MATLMYHIVLALHAKGIDPRDIDPDKVMWAFLKGIDYHDALARGQRTNPELRGVYGPGTTDMDQAFEDWHNAIASALNQKENPSDPTRTDSL